MDNNESIKVILWLGESAGFWIQTLAIFLSALAAIYIIYHNGLMAKKRATIDHIIHQKSNPELLKSIRTVYKLHEGNVQFSSFLSADDSDEYKAIFNVLNNHEFIALGIRRKAFEENIYKELQYSNFVKVYKSSAGIIADLRKQTSTDTLFQEFEWLIRRWEAKPLKRH